MQYQHSMKQQPTVFLTGQNGMVGQRLKQHLSRAYHVVGLERDKHSDTDPTWNYQQSLEQHQIAAPKAVIHLAGAGIADKRWTPAYKEKIFASRINGTRWLVEEMLRHDQRPETFICASAIGYYGHRPGEQLDEYAAPGDNFVTRVAADWEHTTVVMQEHGVRTIQLRFGMVLDHSGGALKNMLTPFKLGLGGRLGDGRQQYSWISLTDAVRAIKFLLEHQAAVGAYNLTTEHAISNAQFTRSLAKALQRPAVMHMPAFMVRWLFGQLADELLLAHAKVYPKRLLDAGFEFQANTIQQGLSEALPT